MIKSRWDIKDEGEGNLGEGRRERKKDMNKKTKILVIVLSLVCYKVHSKFLKCISIVSFLKIVLGSNFNSKFTLCPFLNNFWFNDDLGLYASFSPFIVLVQQFSKCGPRVAGSPNILV